MSIISVDIIALEREIEKKDKVQRKFFKKRQTHQDAVVSYPTTTLFKTTCFYHLYLEKAF